MIETITHGAPQTPFMKFGDTVRIEMPDPAGRCPTPHKEAQPL
jgi:fumarylacetoacetate (FAA) hydrolase